jgi:hypothetical protein
MLRGLSEFLFTNGTGLITRNSRAAEFNQATADLAHGVLAGIPRPVGVLSQTLDEDERNYHFLLPTQPLTGTRRAALLGPCARAAPLGAIRPQWSVVSLLLRDRESSARIWRLVGNEPDALSFASGHCWVQLNKLLVFDNNSRIDSD